MLSSRIVGPSVPKPKVIAAATDVFDGMLLFCTTRVAYISSEANTRLDNDLRPHAVQGYPICACSRENPLVNPRALYELMFRAEPRTYVSRSMFLTVMRRVYGFRIAPLNGSVDHFALHTLNEV